MVVGQSFAELFAVDPDSARKGVSPDQFIAAIHEDDRDRVQREIEATIEACGEYRTEYRVRNSDGEYRWVVARGHVECDEDGEPVTFLGALTDITDRKEAELELEQQQRELTALNNLNGVVQDITSAVIEQSSRDEIAANVCERLAASDSYEFAWICEVDTSTGSLTPRAEAGVEGYIDTIPLSIDGEDATGRGPTGKAVRTGEVQVASAFEDADFEPWREYAREFGYQASAAIPIVHEGTLYGVLGVYANRPRAFDGREQEVVGQLGEIIGHAIGAAQRKQALMSDELVEIEFQIPDISSTLDSSTETSGRITLDHAVPVDDGEFLVYGTATPDARETLTSLVENLSHWESVTVQSEGDPLQFVLRVVDPPVLSVLAARGGYLEGAVVEDGDYQMTIHLAPSVDVRAVIDAVVEAYPTVEMLSRQQITRNRDDPQRAQRDLLADLTDRQRTALETAVHSGFFEWPRTASGEDIAASIGVAPPTFHSHLRKAQRKVFESIFPSTVPETS
jgi:predicted DNA binding protein